MVDARGAELTPNVPARRRAREFSRTDSGPNAHIDSHQSTCAYMAGGLRAVHDRLEALQPAPL